MVDKKSSSLDKVHVSVGSAVRSCSKMCDSAKDCVRSGWAWLFLFMSHNDSSCWRWGRVECVGTCWRIVFSSIPRCCSKLCRAWEERCPWGAEAQTWGPQQCTQCAPLLSPPSIRGKWLPTKICLFHRDSCRKAAEHEAYVFVELKRKLSLLIFASALFQSGWERRPYLLVTKEVLARPWVIPARPAQIKVCRAQSCEN